MAGGERRLTGRTTGRESWNGQNNKCQSLAAGLLSTRLRFDVAISQLYTTSNAARAAAESSSRRTSPSDRNTAEVKTSAYWSVYRNPISLKPANRDAHCPTVCASHGSTPTIGDDHAGESGRSVSAPDTACSGTLRRLAGGPDQRPVRCGGILKPSARKPSQAKIRSSAGATCYCRDAPVDWPEMGSKGPATPASASSASTPPADRALLQLGKGGELLG